MSHGGPQSRDENRGITVLAKIRDPLGELRHVEPAFITSLVLLFPKNQCRHVRRAESACEPRQRFDHVQISEQEVRPDGANPLSEFLEDVGNGFLLPAGVVRRYAVASDPRGALGGGNGRHVAAFDVFPKESIPTGIAVAWSVVPGLIGAVHFHVDDHAGQAALGRNDGSIADGPFPICLRLWTWRMGKAF